MPGTPTRSADTAAPLPVNTYPRQHRRRSRCATPGLTGKGVTVALIDSGVSPMADLAGRVVYGPDLTGTHTVNDLVGHGTAMAGLIAGQRGRLAGRRPQLRQASPRVPGWSP